MQTMATKHERMTGTLVISRARSGGFVVELKLGEFVQTPALGAFKSYADLQEFIGSFFDNDEDKY